LRRKSRNATAVKLPIHSPFLNRTARSSGHSMRTPGERRIPIARISVPRFKNSPQAPLRGATQRAGSGRLVALRRVVPEQPKVVQRFLARHPARLPCAFSSPNHERRWRRPGESFLQLGSCRPRFPKNGGEDLQPTGNYGTRSTSPHPRERFPQRKIETKIVRVAIIPLKRATASILVHYINLRPYPPPIDTTPLHTTIYGVTSIPMSKNPLLRHLKHGHRRPSNPLTYRTL